MSKAVIVAGMAYGDEAKGATVDFLCRNLGANLVVRYNGGHQAAHNVCTPEGLHHTFSQFGSGSFVPGVRTHLSRFMLINPIAMLEEAEHLQSIGVTDIWDRLTVDPQCVIVTPYHRAFNRLQELSRGHRAHGSCGMGIGDARRLELDGLALRAHELLDGHPYRIHLRGKLIEIKQRLSKELLDFRYLLEDIPEVDTELGWFYGVEDRSDQLGSYYREWADKVTFTSAIPLSLVHPVIFEGAQGVLLDEKHGIQPHTTWTNTTFENAQTLLDEARYKGERVKLGCWRSYFTRHGNGPLVTEMDWHPKSLPEEHNTYGRYQGKWRVGGFDWKLANRAVEVCGGIDEIAISHMDLRQLDLDQIEYQLKAPVTIVGHGPTAKDREVRERSSAG